MKSRSVHYGWLPTAMALFIFATSAWADDVPRQSLKNLADYPGRGLSPLYEIAAGECMRIFADDASWHTLPRQISEVLVSPDQSPCFTMRNGDTYYNNLYGNAEAIRWAAEQSWDGPFRLLYNTYVLAYDDDELWLAESAWKSNLQFFSKKKKKWTNYQPIGASSRFGGEQERRFARDENGKWLIACEEGLFRVEDGQWERVKIPVLPLGPIQGVISDSRGRLAVWSNRKGQPGTTIAIHSKDAWQSGRTDRSGPWTDAVIREDGSVAMVGRGQLALIKPSSNGDQPEPLSDSDRQKESNRFPQGRYAIGEDRWSVAANRDGDILFSAVVLPIEASGFVRLPSQGVPQWIGFNYSKGIQLAAGRDGGFLILSEERGLLTLAKDSPEPRQLAPANDFQPGDKLCGSDKEGRVYFKRDNGILVFNPEKKSAPPVASHPLGEIEIKGKRNEISTRSELLATAVDSAGGCWFITPDQGTVMVLPANETTPRLFDDRLQGARSLWPGRNGAMLVLMADGKAALAHDGRMLEMANSLFDLAREQFAAMFAVAPQSPCDNRRNLEGNNLNFPMTYHSPVSPWLATERCLWISDGKAVYRFRTNAAASDKTLPPEESKIYEGDYQFIGPLRSGQLLLANWQFNNRNASINLWRQMEDPEGVATINNVVSPPKEVGKGGHLERPEQTDGRWWFDGDGFLWLHQGFDRVYRTDSPAKWPMLADFGPPEFEFPKGYVWGYHSARVFPGYEVAGEGFRRSCVPTYAEHLVPLFNEGDKICCLTLDGLAWMRFVPDKPSQDAVIRRIRIAWGEKPIAYLGHSEHRAFFLTRGYDSQTCLTMIELPEAEQ